MATAVLDQTAATVRHRSVPLGVLLATVGGFLDAYTYLGFGHVFANAMTGNVVLTGVSLVSRHDAQWWRYPTAILAFLAGAATANLMHLPRPRASIRRPKRDCLVIEFACLAVVAAVPLPACLVTLAVTFVAAVQTSTFRQLGDWPFSSVMATGNLRSIIDAATAWMELRSPDDARKLRQFGSVCFAFLVGAVIGGAATRAWGHYAAWLAAGLLSVAIVAEGVQATRITIRNGSFRLATVKRRTGGTSAKE
jgi:uncharacterized membrane protein YoaK (UPF0700 family)